jgi:hypothetical protein
MRAIPASALAAILLSLLQTVSVSAQTIDHGTCTITYSPIRGSCNYWGFWTSSSDGKASKCHKQGCDISFLIDTFYCIGNPSCDDSSLRSLEFCRAENVCVCDAGWKMYFGKCQEIICEGRYVLYETWEARISGGWREWQCQGREDVDTWVNCDPATPFFDGHNKCYAIAP